MRLAPKRRIRWEGNLETGLEYGALTHVPASELEVVRLGSGDPIVVLPGLAGGWRLLMPLARLLARRYSVTLVGLSSDCGFSRGAANERPIEHANQVARVLGQLRLERPTLLGVSFGGAVALELATSFPQSIGSLAVMGADSQFRGGIGVHLVERILERYPLPADNRFVNQFFNVLHGCRPKPGPMPRFIVESCWKTDQGVMANRLRALDSFDVSDRLWRIDVPSLVLAGSRDVVVPPADQKRLADSIAGARFATIDGGGHVGFLTHRTLVAQQVDRLIRQSARLYR